MTKPIVIEIEQFLSRECCRVSGEYKANFKVCLKHDQHNINYLGTGFVDISLLQIVFSSPRFIFFVDILL